MNGSGTAVLWSALGSSFVLVALAGCIAIPIGVGAAIYLEEYGFRGRLARIVDVNVASLAGVPSVIYGLLGLALFVRVLEFGRGFLAGAATLALLMLPQVILAARDALRAVPPALREGSYALGATRWQTVRHQVLPAALPEILSGLVRSVTRALGEATPLIVLGALVALPAETGTAGGPLAALPPRIFEWMSQPAASVPRHAAAGMIALLSLLVAMTAVAAWIRGRRRFA